jgi:glycosyltransferase involved in cell wall biosynthesis
MNNNILYIPEIDISETNGSGINERNFVKSVIANNIKVLIPKPKNKLSKDIRESENVFFCYKLNRRNPIKYIIYLLSKIYYILYLSKIGNIEKYVFRWGIFPVDILLLGIFTSKKIYLKHLTFLQTSQKDRIVHDIIGFFRGIIIKSKIIYGCDTPSLITKELIQNEFKINRVLIARNGTEVASFESQKRKKEFIYMGKLSKKRNTDKLLAAFTQLEKTIDIYGFGEMDYIVAEHAENFKNINFKGKVEYDYLKRELPKYKYGIDLTSVDTEYGEASYSQKIAQYLSFGLNVIAIDCIDNKFIENKNAGCLVDLESDNLSEKLAAMEYKTFKLKVVKEYIDNENILAKRIRFWKRR